MSEVEPRRSARSIFSLRHLLIFTALVAVGIALGLAYRKNRSLTQQRNDLLSLSSRLKINNENELASAAMPRVANDFNSWQVHVPEGQDYELRLGMGAVSEKGIPSIVGSVPLEAGQHRVTLHTGDSTSEKFRYVVYVDGLPVIEKTMGSDWIPGGWSSVSAISWPRGTQLSTGPLQLAAQSYEPKFDFETGNYFNGQSDRYVTQSGYRLWIDQTDRTYQSASPFVGFPEDSQYQGIGLRDGLRFRTSFLPPYQWTFTRPKFATNEPLLRVEAEFFANDGTVLSSQSQSFQSWQLRNAASGTDSLRWQEEPSQTTHTAFVHATSKSDGGLRPVVEMRWDVSKPDEVGIRLADSPANNQISRWRLSILDGSHHVWREMRVGNRPWITPNDANNASEVLATNSAKPSTKTAILDLGNDATADVRLQLQTNETLPLQIVARNDPRYAGLGLYQGLPLTLGIQIPADLKPTLAVDVVDQHPTILETAFPGGPVFNAIRIELEAIEHDWIWLSAKSKE